MPAYAGNPLCKKRDRVSTQFLRKFFKEKIQAAGSRFFLDRDLRFLSVVAAVSAASRVPAREPPSQSFGVGVPASTDALHRRRCRREPSQAIGSIAFRNDIGMGKRLSQRPDSL
jgi:hypothetical protein